MHISSLFSGLKNEEAIKLVKPPLRRDIVKQFVELLNKEIEKENLARKYILNYKPRKLWNSSFIAFKLSHLKVHDLYYFLSVCKQSQSFGRCFWGCLKDSIKEKEKKN